MGTRRGENISLLGRTLEFNEALTQAVKLAGAAGVNAAKEVKIAKRIVEAGIAVSPEALSDPTTKMQQFLSVRG